MFGSESQTERTQKQIQKASVKEEGNYTGGSYSTKIPLHELYLKRKKCLARKYF